MTCGMQTSRILRCLVHVALQSGLGRVKSNLASSVKRGKMTKEAADAVAARVKGTLDYSEFGSVDIVSLADIL